MVLKTLEFRECAFDDPEFRHNLQEHEQELDRTSREIKQLIKECTDVITAAATLSRCQKQLAKHLGEFNFATIGGSQTDDEMFISHSLKEFGRVLNDIEEERTKILEKSFDQFIKPLEDFRKDQIGNVKAEKKRFDKESTKFYQSQERHLSLSCKKDENILREGDADLQLQRRHFVQASLRYVKSIQEVHERKKFEFVETLWSFLYSWMKFFRLSYDITKDFDPYMKDLQVRVQKTRDSFNAFCAEAETLMNKIKTSEVTASVSNEQYAGFIYLMEKKAFGTTWTKHYCTYAKKTKKLSVVPFSHTHGRIIGTPEILSVKSCFRRSNDSIEKRFCFDVSTEERGYVMTFQALSEEDRLRWMDVMDGKEPVYQVPGKSMKENECITDLNDAGFRFVALCVESVERRGLHEQGLYRVAGVNSKAHRLLQMFFGSLASVMCLSEELTSFYFEDCCENINWADDSELELRTVTSALKMYFRSLREPLMTFRLHKTLIRAAKTENKTERLNLVHSSIESLPDLNRKMLEILVRHLAKVAANSSRNLMTISNLGVCFGPTLLRPEEESVAALVDIKFCNIIVEILIENWQKIFLSAPTDRQWKLKPAELTPLPRPVVSKLPAIDNRTMLTGSFQNIPSLLSESSKLSTFTSFHSPPANTRGPLHVSKSNPFAQPSAGQPPKSSPSMQINPHSSSVYYSVPLETSNSITHITSVINSNNNSAVNNHSEVILREKEPPSAAGRVALAIARLSTPAPYPGMNAALAAQQGRRPSSPTRGLSAVNNQLPAALQSFAGPQKNERTPVIGNSHPNPINQSATSVSPYFVSPRMPERSATSPASQAKDAVLATSPEKSPQRLGSMSTSRQMLSHLFDKPASKVAPSTSDSASTRRRVRTLYQCHADVDSELSFEPNEIITRVRQSTEPGWVYGELRGKVGLVPENYIEELPTDV